MSAKFKRYSKLSFLIFNNRKLVFNLSENIGIAVKFFVEIIVKYLAGYVII